MYQRDANFWVSPQMTSSLPHSRARGKNRKGRDFGVARFILKCIPEVVIVYTIDSFSTQLSSYQRLRVGTEPHWA